MPFPLLPERHAGWSHEAPAFPIASHDPTRKGNVLVTEADTHDIDAGNPPGHMPPTLRTHIVKTLRAQIMSGKYRPGDRFNESQIAREFSISRIPVHEALSQLQEQGLVMNHERRGMFVMQLSSREVENITDLRTVLEAEALRLARAHMTPDVLAELTILVERMEQWDGQLIDAVALDRQFHEALWRVAGNPYLTRALDGLTTALFAHKALEHVSQEIRRWRLCHHRLLLDLVAGGAGNMHEAVHAHLHMPYPDPEPQADVRA